MNQCKLCSSYALNDDPKHKLCDKCLLKKQIEQLQKAILDFGNNPAGFDWAILEKLDAFEVENETLKNLLRQSHAEVCSMNCPSVKKAEDKWTHCKLCEEITKALKGGE